MTQNLKYSLILLLIVLSCINAVNAQEEKKTNRVIATDYNECLTGIKDTLGNWIVTPQYSSIRAVSGNRFVVNIYDGVRRSALIDSNGRYIIPLGTSYIYQTIVPDYYTVSQKKYTGIITSSGDTLLPISYRNVVVREDSSIWTRNRIGHWVHRDAKGNTWKLDHRQRRPPQITYNGYYFAVKRRWILHSKSEILNDSGRAVLPDRYDAIGESRGLFFVSNNKKFGYFDTTGKVVWPIVFDQRYRSRSQYIGHYSESMYTNDPLMGDSVAIVQVGPKTGIISCTGKTYLPFEYDYIESISFNRTGKERFYTVTQKGKSGIYSLTQGWIVPLEYDFIDVIRTLYREPDSLETIMYIGKKDGVYGVSVTSGQTLLPYKYKHHQYNNGYIFYNSDTVVRLYSYPSFLKSIVIKSQLNIPVDSVLPSYDRPAVTSLLPESGMYEKYVHPGSLTVFYHPAHFRDTLFNNLRTYVGQPKNRFTSIPDSVLIASTFAFGIVVPQKKIGDHYLFYQDTCDGLIAKEFNAGLFLLDLRDSTTIAISRTHSDSEYTYYETNKSLLFRSDGKILWESDSRVEITEMMIEGQTHLQFEIASGRSEFSIIDHNGNFIAEKLKGFLDDYNERYMWVGEPARFSRGYYYAKNWKLVDIQTHREINLPAGAQRSSLYSHYIVTETKKQGVSLFDLQSQKYLLQHYNSIEPLNSDGSIFEVTTCSGKIGIMDSTGKLLADTAYLNRIPLHENTSTTQFYYSNDSYEKYARYCSLYNYREGIIFDTELKKIVDDSAIDTYAFRFMNVFDDTTSIDSIAKFNSLRPRTATTQFLIFKTDSIHLQDWHNAIMLDSICRPLRYSYNYWGDLEGNVHSRCTYCEKKTGKWSYLTPYTDRREFLVRMVSDSVFSYSSVSRYRRTSWFSTVVLFKDGPRNMTLDSLFNPQTDWKNFVINTVITYVNTHLYVHGDCHNPAGFPILLRERFVFTNAGIVLYPEDFTENNHEMTILIPWADAMPYLRTDVKTKIPVNK